MPRRYLGCDFGTKTGHALIQGRQLEAFWKRHYSKNKDEESNGPRFARFRDDLMKAIEDLGVDVLVYEDVNPRVHRSNAQRKLWHGWLCVAQMAALDSGVDIIGVNLKTMKAVAGHGNFTKQDMERAARDKWDLPAVISEDEVDAIWAAETARLRMEDN